MGINTALPNRLVEEALREDRIPELAGYDECAAKSPMAMGRGSTFCSAGPAGATLMSR